MTITPSVSLENRYNDNIFLDRTNARESWILALGLGAAAAWRGFRSQAGGSYAMSLLHYNQVPDEVFAAALEKCAAASPRKGSQTLEKADSGGERDLASAK